MRVLMLGWDFPPVISGGIGSACRGLTKALNQAGVEITLIHPRSAEPKTGAPAAPPPPVAHPAPVSAMGDGTMVERADGYASYVSAPPAPLAPQPPPPPPGPPVHHAVSSPPRPDLVGTAAPARMGPVEQPVPPPVPHFPPPLIASKPQRIHLEPCGRLTSSLEFVEVDAWLRPYQRPDQPPYRQVEHFQVHYTEVLEPAAPAPQPAPSGPIPAPWPWPAASPSHVCPSPWSAPAPVWPSWQAPATPPPTSGETARGIPPWSAQAPAAGLPPVLVPPARLRLGPRRSVEPAGQPPPPSDELFHEVDRYTEQVKEAARQRKFDVIHCHDWMTFPAGIAVAEMTGKPLVVHVHSTEFDRAGRNIDQRIYEIERQGMSRAQRVVAVSFMTKNLITSRYAIPVEKVVVVYNAVETPHSAAAQSPVPLPIRGTDKIVLFLGRITPQKGPEYFLAAARKVLQVYQDVCFVMAGSGDMVRESMELASDLGISGKVLFTGFLQGPDVERIFRSADLYVMPSVSEPFGISSLEALSYDVPVLVSKQSGVAEVLEHVLKADFWDVEDMANKIVAVLRHPPLRATLSSHAGMEVRRLNWDGAAQRCLEAYGAALAACGISLPRPGPNNKGPRRTPPRPAPVSRPA